MLIELLSTWKEFGLLGFDMWRGVKCRKDVPTHVLDTYYAAFWLLLYEDVDLLAKHIDKWLAETEEAKEIAMILQHARAINRKDVQ
ncbi:hypothetical protein FCV25MIE_16443, partial [Fagus crenata]